jgi:Uma2 family endonuclease
MNAETAVVERPGQSLWRALPEEEWPSLDGIVTEDDTPVDNIFSEKQQRLLTEPLHSSWPGPSWLAPGRGYLALANVGLFYTLKKPPLVPDMLLSVDLMVRKDLSRKENRSYFGWVYGKPPEVVIEVVSNQEGGEDTKKLRRYAEIEIPYYVIHDPLCELSKEVLRIYRLEGKRYRRQAELWLVGVELGLTLWQGEYENWEEEVWLRWVDRQGRLIPTGVELAKQERLRAEQAQLQVAQERARAEQERIRAERLAAHLRELGIEPDA